MSLRDWLVRLGGGTPEPKPDPEPVAKRKWTPPGMDRLPPNDYIDKAIRNAEELQRQIDREAQRLRDRQRARSHYNPYRNVPPFMGWDVTPKDAKGALPIVFDIHRNRIHDADVIGWGGEEHRRVLTYGDRNGSHRYTVVDEPEFIRWKNRQPS